jgi:biopolymer transport protein TolR
MAMTPNSPGAANINMTPMIDILLVLIIIFMVITPLTPKGFNAQVPREPESKSAPDDTVVVVSIDAKGFHRINHALTPIETLETRLREIFARRGSSSIFLKADPTLEYQALFPAIAASRAAGIDRVGLLTE